MPAKKEFEDRTEGYKEQTRLTNGLNTRHRELMRELSGGATIAQASARCNFSVGRIRQLLSSELFAKELSRMEDNIDQKAEDRIADGSVSQTLKEASSGAAKTLVKAATSGEMNSLRVASAKDLLDRTGYKAVDEVVADLSVEAGEGLKHALATYVKDKKGKENEAD